MLMPPLASLVLQFLVCGGLILWAGVRLTWYGDMIAEKTGLGGTWVGLLLMATVTSLPELISGASAVVLYDVTDIATGGAIGSCMLNLLVLALLDLRAPEPFTVKIHQGHVLTAAFGIVQFGLVVLALLAGPRAPALGWFGVHSLLTIGLYVFAMRTIFVFERTRLGQIAQQLAAEEQYADVSIGRAIALYAGTAGVLVAAATYLPGLGEQLADLTALSEGFVGSLFIASATVLPEIAVSFAAVRMGAVDMAAANLFGSNLFNMAVLGIDDLLYTRGTLLATVSAEHLVSFTAAILMTAVAIVGLTYRASRKRYRLSSNALAIIAIYAIALTMLGR